MSSDTQFAKENMDFYLKELAKELKKLGVKNVPVEIILIGGASVLANYSFRGTTTDIDAIISAPSVIKDAINHVGDRYGLPNDWLNTDFIRTKSYTPKLVEFSTYYKTFIGILTVRTIAAENLIAMKLRAGRRYKNDLSDVVGIINEHTARGEPMTFERVDKAMWELYGSWDGVSDEMKEFAVSVLAQPSDPTLYKQYQESEKRSKNILMEIEQQYPNAVNEDNIDTILERAKRKQRSKDEPER